jgi:hypothetical protein
MRLSLRFMWVMLLRFWKVEGRAVIWLARRKRVFREGLFLRPSSVVMEFSPRYNSCRLGSEWSPVRFFIMFLRASRVLIALCPATFSRVAISFSFRFSFFRRASWKDGQILILFLERLRICK